MAADPCFFLYPDAAGSLAVIDFARPLTSIHELPSGIVSDAYGGDRTWSRTFHAGVLRIRFTAERVNTTTTAGQSFVRKMLTVQQHLIRGGYVGLARVHSKAWCGRVSTSRLARGTASIVCRGGNLFSSWNSNAALAASDEIVIESANPEAIREWNAVQTVATSGVKVTLTTSDTVFNTYTAEPILVRHRDFWPILRLPADQVDKQLVIPDRRLTYTIDMTLEYDQAAIARLVRDTYGSLGLRTDGGSKAGRSLEEALAPKSGRTGVYNVLRRGL